MMQKGTFYTPLSAGTNTSSVSMKTGRDAFGEQNGRAAYYDVTAKALCQFPGLLM